MHPIDYVITVSHYAVLYLEKLHEGEMQPMTLIKISWATLFSIIIGIIIYYQVFYNNTSIHVVLSCVTIYV